MQTSVADKLLGSLPKHTNKLISRGVSRQDAEDAIGEAWLKLHDYQLREGGSLDGLITRTLFTIALDSGRTDTNIESGVRVRRIAGSLDDPDMFDPVDPISLKDFPFEIKQKEKDFFDKTFSALGLTDPRDRMVLYLQLQGLTDKEAAVFLNVSVGSYKSALFRARETLLRRYTDEDVKDIFQTFVTEALLTPEESISAGIIFSRLFSSEPSTPGWKRKTPQQRFSVTPEVVVQRKEFARLYFEKIQGEPPQTLREAIRFVAKDLGVTFLALQEVVYGDNSFSPRRHKKLVHEGLFRAEAELSVVLVNPKTHERYQANPERNKLRGSRQNACNVLRRSIPEFAELKDSTLIRRLFGFKSEHHGKLLLLGLRHVATKGMVDATIQSLSLLGHKEPFIAKAVTTFLPPATKKTSLDSDVSQRIGLLKLMAASEEATASLKPKAYAQQLFGVTAVAADQLISRSAGDLSIKHARSLLLKLGQLREDFPEIFSQASPTCFFSNAAWYQKFSQDPVVSLGAFRSLLVTALMLKIHGNGTAAPNSITLKTKKLSQILSHPTLSEAGTIKGPLLGNESLDELKLAQLKLMLREHDLDPNAANLFTPYGLAWTSKEIVNGLRQIVSQQLLGSKSPLMKHERYKLLQGDVAQPESIDYLITQTQNQTDWFQKLLTPEVLQIAYKIRERIKKTTAKAA